MLRRNSERRHLTHAKNKIWQSFYPTDEPIAARGGFADLLRFDEVRVPPSGVLPPLDIEGDSFTYVHRGAIAQHSASSSLLAQSGDFQCRATSSHQETNTSSTDWAHIFRLRIKCVTVEEDSAPAAPQQERFTAAQRRNTLCMVASPDGASGSLVLRSDAFIYSSVLDLGHHFVHALQPRRSAWLHVISGQATLDTTVELSQGDGVGISGAPSVSVTAHEGSEILLVDMGPATNS